MLTEGSPLYDKWVPGWGSREFGGIDIRADYYRATISFTTYGVQREKTVDVVRTPIFLRHQHWKGYHKTYFECPVCTRRCEILYI
jgi:hypothetical protein